MINQDNDLNTTHDLWKSLYKVGGVAALIILAIYLIELIVVIAFGLPPTTIQTWFALFQGNKSLGLLRSFSLDIVATLLHGPIFLALSFALSRNRKSYSALLISTTFAFVGMAVYFASNTVFSLLFLSDQYASATTEVQKSMFLTAGQAMLAIYNGTGPFMAFTLYAVAGLVISIVMLQSKTFSRKTAWAGIIGFILQLGPPPGYGPDIFFKIDPILIGIGGVFLLVWLALIAARLFELGKDQVKEGKP
jgi:hypothetical protein